MNQFGSLIAVALLALILSGCVDRVVYERPAAPAARVEVVGVAPYPRAVWVKGHWDWRGGRYGGYVWVPGHWRRY